MVRNNLTHNAKIAKAVSSKTNYSYAKTLAFLKTPEGITCLKHPLINENYEESIKNVIKYLETKNVNFENVNETFTVFQTNNLTKVKTQMPYNIFKNHVIIKGAKKNKVALSLLNLHKNHNVLVITPDIELKTLLEEENTHSFTFPDTSSKIISTEEPQINFLEGFNVEGAVIFLMNAIIKTQPMESMYSQRGVETVLKEILTLMVKSYEINPKEFPEPTFENLITLLNENVITLLDDRKLSELTEKMIEVTNPKEEYSISKKNSTLDRPLSFATLVSIFKALQTPYNKALKQINIKGAKSEVLCYDKTNAHERKTYEETSLTLPRYLKILLQERINENIKTPQIIIIDDFTLMAAPELKQLTKLANKSNVTFIFMTDNTNDFKATASGFTGNISYHIEKVGENVNCLIFTKETKIEHAETSTKLMGLQSAETIQEITNANPIGVTDEQLKTTPEWMSYEISPHFVLNGLKENEIILVTKEKTKCLSFS